MTRPRADASHVPHLPLVAEYFTQRAHRPGTRPMRRSSQAVLAALPTHRVFILKTRLPHRDRVPQVVDAVDAKRSFIFSQQAEDLSFPYVSASDVQLSGMDVPPRPLTVPEIKEYVALFAQSAKNAIEAPSFTPAKGYLIHQFLHDEVNSRTDDYGGSVKNRARSPLEIVDAAHRIEFKTWPCAIPSPPSPTSFANSLSAIPTWHTSTSSNRASSERSPAAMTPSVHTDLTTSCVRPGHRAGGYTRKMALEKSEEGDDLINIAFGLYFTSNPDLVTRIEKDIPFKPYDRPTFYLAGDSTRRGYTDRPFAA
ncbi:putative inactive dehydrogenase EasA [Favolaschia claudopus]|uniref:Inactive dehydrogenase EasA n=1 Tax=Favolaschia claudopus TaxID=2862362 RepID=A0AAW0BYI2_9AGAR